MHHLSASLLNSSHLSNSRSIPELYYHAILLTLPFMERQYLFWPGHVSSVTAPGLGEQRMSQVLPRDRDRHAICTVYVLIPTGLTSKDLGAVATSRHELSCLGRRRGHVNHIGCQHRLVSGENNITELSTTLPAKDCAGKTVRFPRLYGRHIPNLHNQFTIDPCYASITPPAGFLASRSLDHMLYRVVQLVSH